MWRLGSDEFYTNGYKIILQGHTTKTNDKGRVMAGVCIILNPLLDAAHKLAKNSRIMLPEQHEHEG